VILTVTAAAIIFIFMEVSVSLLYDSPSPHRNKGN
jgi:hypothetical protein